MFGDRPFLLPDCLPWPEGDQLFDHAQVRRVLDEDPALQIDEQDSLVDRAEHRSVDLGEPLRLDKRTLELAVRGDELLALILELGGLQLELDVLTLQLILGRLQLVGALPHSLLKARIQRLELRFGPPLRCDVVCEHQMRCPAVEAERVRHDLDVDQRPVLALVTPRPRYIDPLGGALEIGRQRRYVLTRANVSDRQAKELCLRVAVLANRGIVDGNKRERFQVIDPHRMRVALKEHFVLLLRVSESPLQPHCAAGSWRRGARFGAKPSDEELLEGPNIHALFRYACGPTHSSPSASASASRSLRPSSSTPPGESAPASRRCSFNFSSGAK